MTKGCGSQICILGWPSYSADHWTVKEEEEEVNRAGHTWINAWRWSSSWRQEARQEKG